MNIDLLVFVPACFALNLAFGPNNLLSMTHAAQQGIGYSLAASTGRLPVFILMILASALGMGVLLSTSALAFTVVKLFGAAYLIWLGIKLIRSRANVQTAQIGDAKSNPHEGFRREVLAASSNPKAILIFAAFFPQFVDVHQYWQSYLLLGSIFLVLEFIAIAIYAFAGRFAAAFAASKLHWLQRSSGGAMIVFGFLLLFSRPPARGTDVV